MSKATETALGELHAAVARQLAKQIDATEIMEIDGKEIEISTASPALLGQAIKFLKDNSITADPDKDENLTNLAEVLEKKRKQGSVVKLVPAIEAAGEDT